MKLSIIIINYKTWKMTSECVDSILAANLLCSYEVVVVDNDSGDGSYEKLFNIYDGKDTKVKVIQAGENGGFSKGNNVGASVASGEYLFFFNSDTLLKSYVLDEMITFMDCRPEYGALTCLSVNAEGECLNNGHVFPTAATMAKELFVRPLVPGFIKAYARKRRSLQAKGLATDYDWISGSGLLMPSELFRAIGGWDESYFMYMEDVSLCQEVRRAGRKCAIYNKLGFVHFLGDGAGSPRVIFEASRSEIVYYRKYGTGSGGLTKRLALERARQKCRNAACPETASILKKLKAV